ncbi:MAG: hypothetical protein H6908_02130 [Hyphomicrobiales bacterium]|nr:hypothetical protein [Hyphomicrobiales bacterium]
MADTPPRPINLPGGIMNRTAVLLLVILLVWIGVYLLNLEQRYQNEGVLTSGKIIGKEIDIGARGIPSYVVVFEFLLANGDMLTNKESFSRDRWLTFAEDDIVDVLYLPEKPKIHVRILPDDNLALAYSFIVGGVVIVLSFPLVALHNLFIRMGYSQGIRRMISIYGICALTGFLFVSVYLTYYSFVNRVGGHVVVFSLVTIGYLWLVVHLIRK